MSGINRKNELLVLAVFSGHYHGRQNTVARHDEFSKSSSNQSVMCVKARASATKRPAACGYTQECQFGESVRGVVATSVIPYTRKLCPIRLLQSNRGRQGRYSRGVTCCTVVAFQLAEHYLLYHFLDVK